MTIEQDARAEAASYARHAIGGMQPVGTVGDKVRNAFISGYLAGAQRTASPAVTRVKCHTPLCPGEYCADCGTYNPGEEAY